MPIQRQPTFEVPIVQGTLGALNETVILELDNASGAIANISGTWSGTIVFEGTNDDFQTSQNAAVFTPPAGVITAGVTANGYYRFVAVSGFTRIRARMSAYSSGSAMVIISSSIGAGLAPTVSINYASMLGTSKIVGGNGVHLAEVELIEGHPSLRTFGIQAIESLRGFDPIPDVWFYIGTEEDSQGAGAAGDTVRIQIAAGDNPISFPAVDLTYTLQAGDAGDEEVLATSIAAFLNADSGFNALWRAQRIANSGVVYISSKKPGGQFERPNSDDFIVSSTGTTIVTRAFDKIIRQNKVTSLARDPSDPRQGILGIQGSVVQTEGDVTSRFQTVFPELRVNGSVTPVNFIVSAHPTEVIFVTSIVISGRANGIKFGQFLSSPTLANGIQVSFKSNDFSAAREPLKTTDDLLDFHAEDPDNFVLFIQSGGDKFTAVLEFGSPLEIRPQGEFSLDDFVKISVRDNLSSGLLQLRAIVSGFNREF